MARMNQFGFATSDIAGDVTDTKFHWFSHANSIIWNGKLHLRASMEEKMFGVY